MGGTEREPEKLSSKKRKEKRVVRPVPVNAAQLWGESRDSWVRKSW